MISKQPEINMGIIEDDEGDPIDWELKCSFVSVAGYNVTYNVQWTLNDYIIQEESFEKNHADSEELSVSLSSDMFSNVTNIREVITIDTRYLLIIRIIIIFVLTEMSGCYILYNIH